MDIIMGKLVNPLKNRKTFLLFVFLLLAGIGGNLINITLLPGVYFIFGSIAALVALYVYDAVWGILLGTAAAATYYNIWHQPYIFIIFLSEFLFIALLRKKKNINVLLADALFWLFVGMPLSWLFFYGLLKMGLVLSFVLVLKLIVNGLLNALIAGIALIYLPLYKFLGSDYRYRHVSFYYTVFNVLVALILIPSLLIIFVQNKKEVSDINTDIYAQLNSVSKLVSNQLEFWHNQHMHALKELVILAGNKNKNSVEELQKATDYLNKGFPDFVRMHIDDANGTALTFSPKRDENGKVSIGQNFSDRDYYSILRNSGKPYMSDLFMGKVGIHTPIVIMGIPIINNGVSSGYVIGNLNLSSIANILKINSIPSKYPSYVTVLDSNNKVIASTRKGLKVMSDYYSSLSGERITDSKSTFIWIPEKYKNSHLALQWDKAVYIKKMPLSDELDWNIVVEVPYAPFLNNLTLSCARNLSIMAGLVLLALLISSFVSRKFSSPVTQLAAVTTDLPLKLYNQADIKWPASFFSELDSLITNYRIMAGNLRQNFQDLQTQFSFLESLVNTIPSPVFYKNANGIYIGCNDAYEKYIGLSKDQVIGSSVYDLYDKELAEIYRTKDLELFEKRGVQIYESKLMYADGTEHDVVFNKAVFYNADGSLGGLVGVVLDITDLKKAELELKRQQEQLKIQYSYASAINKIAESIIAYDDIQTILETMVRLVGETLQVDQTVIYEIQTKDSSINKLCGWENPAVEAASEFPSHLPLQDFINCHTYIINNRKWIESHADMINMLFRADGMCKKLHQALNVRSILLYPFSFSNRGYNVLIFNQLKRNRRWNEDEIDFINAVTKQVEIAIQKIYYLEERKRSMEDLQKLSAAIKASMDGIAVVNSDLEIVDVNEAYARIFGFDSPEKLKSSKMHILYTSQEREKIENEVMPILQKDGSWRGEAIGTRRDGSSFPQEVSFTLLKDGGIVCIARDITKRKEAEKIIWEEKERAQVTLHSIGDAVITTDAYGNITYLNPVAEILTGWNINDAKGSPLPEVFKIVNEQTGEPVENPVAKCLREGIIVGLANHTQLINKEGKLYAIEDSAAPIRDKEGNIIGVVMVFHDVSEKRDLLRQMTYQAYHDPLTGLPNRVLFHDRLSRALAQAKRNNEMVAVLFLDLDRFKVVNDMLGHVMGDQLLKEVAIRLTDCVRNSDTIARLGGDEFILLLPKIVQTNDAAIVAEKVLQAMQKPFIITGHEFHISGSIGIAVYPNDGDDAETLMKHADTAMYRSKEKGRNSYQLFAPFMNAKIHERIAMENSLRHALERHEFEIFYQPQINAISGEIIGMEALLRWNHPEKGIVTPDQFIPLAEETGLIVPIGEWVLKTACKQNKAWQDAGYKPMRVTVNLSGRQFQQKDLLDKIARTLDETGLDPRLLELEITESVAMADVDFTIQTLKKISEMGIQLAIDDFGTGYSSLSYIKQFPINTVKIDRSFIMDISTDPGDAAIVATIIVMATNLNLNVIAEGVETVEQIKFLKENNCKVMQGYYFSKPVPTPQFEELIKNGIHKH